MDQPYRTEVKDFLELPKMQVGCIVRVIDSSLFKFIIRISPGPKKVQQKN